MSRPQPAPPDRRPDVVTGPLLLLVRHGESTWNAAGTVQGQCGWPALTGRGRAQAAEAAGALTGCGAVRLVSSDAVRALQTAAAIAPAVDLPVETTPLLRERHWGRLQGGPVAVADATDARLPDDVAVPGGESRLQVRIRLQRLLELLDGEGPAVLVTHGDVIGEAQRLWGGAGTDLPGNGSVTGLRVPALPAAAVHS